ncbi:2OG-Fe(II) oxygenase [Wenzhouxiangella marina]|uniref:SM-20-related protein n=1 Tax=Wenzhouxiangella marina TaxID=1579979 RepID=A0A0K0XUP3_9GAMM|nr:2OG-Fe(II) oxygenase [Wenzhouxiangella marina]AKS41385.1 SM-20-related protein [Wenzhouxiangella marina]MBB6086861.1 SM-20-related protein [Wenzhouxiangella marina]
MATTRPSPEQEAEAALTVPLPLVGEAELLEQAADALGRNGWWHGTQMLDSAQVAALIEELDALREADRLHRAGIGRELDFQIDSDIRRDRIVWLNRQRPVQSAFLDQMERLRLALNRRLFLGLFEFEGHFAHYPPGGFYKRHLDSFRGAANRLVSVVVYLNRDWQAGDSGELVLFSEDESETLAVIEPRAGSMALFLSEEIPHEVRPAHKDRSSIAGWFRLNASIDGQIDPPR